MTDILEKDAVVDRLDKLCQLVAQIAANLKPKAPNYRHPITAYWTFDWPTIGAMPVASDQQGVSAVQWAGYTWMRRSSGGKFGKAIWFSRSDGKDEEGNNNYLRLITFKELSDPEPLDGRVVGMRPISNAPTPPQYHDPLTQNTPPLPKRPLSQENTPSISQVAGITPLEARVRVANDSAVFARLFVQLNPDWQTADFVLKVREEVLAGCPPVTADIVYDALLRYKEAFRDHQRVMGTARSLAHNEAIAAARELVATALLGAEDAAL